MTDREQFLTVLSEKLCDIVGWEYPSHGQRRLLRVLNGYLHGVLGELDSLRTQQAKDDAEPVTEDWLRSIGFCYSPCLSSLEYWPLEYVLEEGGYFPENWILNGGDPPESMKLNSRGAVRRLCLALGISLKSQVESSSA